MPSFIDMIGVLGAIVSIATFLHQIRPGISKYANKILLSARPVQADIRSSSDSSLKEGSQGFWVGILFAFLSLILWSVSHVTFRTPQAIEIDPVFLSGVVLLLGGLFTAAISFSVFLGQSRKPELGVALRPLLGWRGIVVIGSNALEAIFYVMAMQLIQAAQVMALWKSNALWILGLLLLFSDEKVKRVSIASTFCVLAGVIYIVKPSVEDLSGEALTIFGQVISVSLFGSVVSILGGLFFAIYSVSIHFYPIKTDSESFPERIALQALILSVTGAAILASYWIYAGFPSLEYEAWRIIIFNALRLGVVYICYAEAIKRTGKPLLVACVLAIEIPLTMFIEHIWIGSSLDPTIIYGGAIIVIGALSILREHQYMPSSSYTRKRDWLDR